MNKNISNITIYFSKDTSEFKTQLVFILHDFYSLDSDITD